jgi:hypothetical protein
LGISYLRLEHILAFYLKYAQVLGDSEVNFSEQDQIVYDDVEAFFLNFDLERLRFFVDHCEVLKIFRRIWTSTIDFDRFYVDVEQRAHDVMDGNLIHEGVILEIVRHFDFIVLNCTDDLLFHTFSQKNLDFDKIGLSFISECEDVSVDVLIALTVYFDLGSINSGIFKHKSLETCFHIACLDNSQVAFFADRTKTAVI